MSPWCKKGASLTAQTEKRLTISELEELSSDSEPEVDQSG